MRALFLFAALVFAATLAGLASFSAPLLGVAAAGLAYLAASFASEPDVSGWRAKRSIDPECPAEGQRVTVRLDVSAAKPAFALLIDDLPSGIDPSSQEGSRAFVGKVKDRATIEYSFIAARGPLRFGDLKVDARGMVGGAKFLTQLPASAVVYCPPMPSRRADLRLTTRKTLAYTGDIRSRTPGAGEEFFGVREYRPGDPLRRVNRRSSARVVDAPGASAAPFVNDFERRRNADVGFILDTRLSQSALDRRDMDIDAFARLELSLAEDCARKGHRISHMTFGMPLRWVTPGHGRFQAKRIKEALAAAEPSEPASIESIAYIPDSVFPHQSVLFLFLKTLGEEEATIGHLISKRYKVIVITSDKERMALRAAQRNRYREAGDAMLAFDRAEQLATMRRMGAVVYDLTTVNDESAAAEDISRLLFATSGKTRAGGRP